MKADLHLHTTASDGRLEPGELVRLAAKAGLDVIAITDHDTTNGIAPALAATEHFPSLTVIPGVEVSTDVPHSEVHVLGYFIDYTDQNLAAALQGLRSSREGRARKMISKLANLGMRIEWKRVQELAQGGSIGRPHIAKALLERGYVVSERGAFDRYIGREGPAYVEREKLLPVEAVKLIIKARGLPVLAHPANIGNLDELIPELKLAGMVGVEVYYGEYATDVIDRLLRVARRHNLIPTGGTDYHAFGHSSEVMIGQAFAPQRSVERLFDLADKRSLALVKRH
jgi:predicted metal-dependent phosphoesterase TrpH